MNTILICDDDKDIVSALDIYLTSEGYATVKAYDGLECLRLAEREPVDLILLDVMMPGLDGIRTTAKLRESCNVPIILLTAKSEDSDKILGLNIGADDYITKPFNPIEVIARVKSQLRRYTSLGGKQGGGEANPALLTNGGIALDDGAKSVTVDGEGVSLTPIEYNILLLLMKNPGRVFSTSQIYELVWNDPSRLGKHGGGPHPPPAGEAGDRPGQPPVHQGGLGAGVQDGKGLGGARSGRTPPIFQEVMP